MTKFSNSQLHDIAEWCSERGILPHRVTGEDVKAACDSLGFSNDGDFDLYQIKEIGDLM